MRSIQAPAGFPVGTQNVAYPTQQLSATPGTLRSSAPHLGDDTDAVLGEMGFGPADIAALRGKGVVA